MHPAFAGCIFVSGAPGGREVKYRVWNNDLGPLVVRTGQFSVTVYFAAL